MLSQDKVTALKDAIETGHIVAFHDTDMECTQECDYCPAKVVCTVLSGRGHYDLFVKNYKKYILPEFINTEYYDV